MRPPRNSAPLRSSTLGGVSEFRGVKEEGGFWRGGGGRARGVEGGVVCVRACVRACTCVYVRVRVRVRVCVCALRPRRGRRRNG